MKWTLIAVSALGAVTYAVIFVSQLQYERPTREAVVADTPAATPAEVEPVDRAFEEPALTDGAVDSSFATPDAEGVSHSTNDAQAATAESGPSWEGDAWPAGVSAYEEGDLELARAALEQAVREKETAPYRHYLLGLTYRRLGESEAAVAELTRSLELAPHQIRALVNLGRAHLDQGEIESAREAVDAALEIDLEFADAWQVLGRIELESGSFEEAAAAFAKATDRDPEHAWAWNNLGYARIQLERFDEAVEPLRRALATGREEAVFYNNLGIALERTGHEHLASVAFARAALLGHGPAESSFGRVETVLLARGEAVPSFDEIEALDAITVAALAAGTVDEPVIEGPAEETEVEIALDEALGRIESGEQFDEFEEFEDPIQR